ncbi:hypothetical protein [Pseudomonas chlororaphis]|uniref:hypothetical protein n=1 Tax=Pseudomonas chlororaphis TaxID=587753 RepID=UPI002407B163|nr:hypothetical protein [Pseudomonas chlororaphis]
MKRIIWMIRAYLYMRSRCGWARWDMVGSLYETYVDEDADSDWSPQDAVDEDMSYWGD